MSKIMQKLHSRSGASMLLAMVFIMFCTFVGGTVLAAATANGSRVAKLIYSEQAYLSQRSAAMIMADQLKGDSANQLQLTIVETTENDTVKAPVFTPHSADLTEFQNLLYSLAQKEYGLLEVNKNTPLTGSISITDPLGKEKYNLSATYSMDKNYNFTITFEDSTFHLDLEPVVGSSETQRQELGADGVMKMIRTKTTVIRWNDPVIVKGGA